MCEISLGTILVVWSSGSPRPLGRQAFGHTGSFMVVAAMMLLVALGMLVVMLPGRVPRTARISLLLTLSIGAGLLMTILITNSLAEDQAPGILLVLSLIAIFLVVQEITRATKEKRP